MQALLVTLAPYLEQVLQVLYLSLQLLYQCIILCVDLISLDDASLPHPDPLGSVSELERGYGLLGLLGQGGHSGKEEGMRVAS